LDEHEIVGVINENNGMTSHCAVKGYGVQNVAIIERLIREKTASFFILDKENKLILYSKTSSNGTTYLTTNPHGFYRNRLNVLPICDKPLLKQLIEPAR
jgi:hypothetical protein